MAIAAAEHGLRIMGAPMALWLVHQFLDDGSSATCRAGRCSISRYDWIIFPPRIPIVLATRQTGPGDEPAAGADRSALRVAPAAGEARTATQARPERRDQLFFDEPCWWSRR